MSVSVFNRVWSKVLLETLVRQGVQHFCIAPGSRSTPLTLEAVALQNASKARCYVHFDERVEMDVWYMKNWSLWNDVIILLKTIHTVIKRDGAS